MSNSAGSTAHAGSVDVDDVVIEDDISVHHSTTDKIIRWVAVALLFYALIVSLDVIGSGFKYATGDNARTLFDFATNPLVGLMIGILATTLIQSSSTTTSIVVGLVAGGLPVGIAVPIIMGANIGTTLTNTLASLGAAGDKLRFRRAFAAATVHDFFNLLAVAIFLPLEIATGFIEKSAGALAGVFRDTDGAKSKSVLDYVVDPVSGVIIGGLKNMPFSPIVTGSIIAVVGAIGILLVVRYLGVVLGQLMVGTAKKMLRQSIGRGPMAGIGSGVAVTVLAQSSSVTTSLMVPFAAAGTLKVRQIYPYTLGANVGTTFTALLAAMAASSNAEQALQIAFVHLLFNIFGIVLIYGVPFLRALPLRGCNTLARLGTERKIYVVAWVLGVYIVLPLIAVAITRAIG